MPSASPLEARSTRSAPSCRRNTPAKSRPISTPPSSGCATRSPRWGATRSRSWPGSRSPTSCSRPGEATGTSPPASPPSPTSWPAFSLRPSAASARPRRREHLPMSQSLLLPMLAGVAAGLAIGLVFILLYKRSQRQAAGGVLAVAQREAARLRADAAREAEAAKAETVLAAKMETLKLREDFDHEIQRKRDEWGRVERRGG